MSQYYPFGIISVGSSLQERYPLVQSRCHYEILDVYTIANLVQDYYSQARTARDVEYVFPLPPGAAVCSFKAIIDDSRIIKGIVKEKGEAKREYREAVARGKTAGLLQQEHADVFRVSLGNIQPNQKISVHISYVSIVPHDGGSPQSLRITMPTAIAPRYGQAPPSIPWFSNNTKNRFELTVAIQMGKPVTAVTSPSHLIGLTLGCAEKELRGDFDPTRAFVYLGDAAFLDKDIVIVIAAQGLDVPRCSVERWLASEGAEETTDAYALTLVPKFDLPALPSQEYIFLVDRSGSMEGGRMKSVKTALQIMLRSLPSENTTFNIISFGDHNKSLWPKSQVYTAETVAMASKHVDTFTADYGGTEIREALQFAIQSRLALTLTSSKENPPASVFVLTDGEAWDLDGVVDVVTESVQLAKTQNNLLRTFVMGVGDQVSTAMCEGIARAGKGSSVFVATGEKPDAKLVSLLKAARGAVIEDLTVDWGVSEHGKEPEEGFEMVSGPSEAGPMPQSGLPPINLFDEQAPSTDSTEVGPKKEIVRLPPPPVIQQAPKSDKLPIPLYPGFRCSIFAIVKQSSNPGPPSSTVRITGKVMGRDVSFQTPVIARGAGPDVTSRAIESGKLLHTLAAKALIQVYEDVPSTPTIKAHIERLGKRYSLASSMTSFLAIDEDSKRESHDVKEPASRRRPRSRSPNQIAMQERGQSRSRSRERTQIIMPRSRSRTRSRSPVTVWESHRHRSRSPAQVIIAGESRRLRSRSPQQIIVSGPSERPHSSQPIIIGEDGRRSRGLLSRIFGGSRRSPTRVITTGGRRSRSNSPRRVLGSRRSRSPPVIINADRSPSRSPSRRYGSRREDSPPPVIIAGSRRSRSCSPRRRERRSGSPVRLFEGDRSRRYGHSPSWSPSRRRSYSPGARLEGSQYDSVEYDRGYDPVEYDRGDRRHRGYGYSPRQSPSPTRRGGSLFGGLFERGTKHGVSKLDPVDYDRSRRRHSPRGGPRYGPEYDRGPRGGSPQENSPRRLSQIHSLQEPEELDTGPPRSGRPQSRRLTGLSLSPPRTRLTHRSPSKSVSPEGTRHTATHHSGRQSPPTTGFLREDEEYHSPTIPVDLDSELQGPGIVRMFIPPTEPVTRTWYSKRPKGPETSYTMGDPRHEDRPEPPSPPKFPPAAYAPFPRRQTRSRAPPPLITPGYEAYDPTIEDAGQADYGPSPTRRYRPSSLLVSSQGMDVERVHIGFHAGGGDSPSRFSRMLSFMRKKKRDSTSSLPDAPGRPPISPPSSSYNTPPPDILTNVSRPPVLTAHSPTVSSASHRLGSLRMPPIIPKSTKMAPLTLEMIVRSQQFNGSFPNDQVFLAQICGNKPVPGIPVALRDLTGKDSEETVKMGIWATVIAVAFLRRKFALEKDSWEIVVEKAIVFIKNALDGNGALADTLITDAEGLF